MHLLRTFARATALLPLVAHVAAAQALTNVTSLYVSYITRKATTNPAGELKARIDSLDRDLQVASRSGRTSEVRRLLAKGNVLLSNRQWTDVADYNASLLVRTDRVVVESQRPYTVRLEQLYAPTIELSRSLSAHATLTARPIGGAANQPPILVKDLGRFEGVSRDLRESPFQMEFDVRDVPDGRYTVVVDITDSTRALGSATLGIVLRKGLDQAVSRFEGAAKRAPESLRAELLFPVDRIRHVNRGDLELRSWDIDRDLAATDSLVSVIQQGADPFARRTGDMKRHYWLTAANEILPYRLYVPRKYVATRSMPLIVALHGLGQTEDSFFDAYGKKLPQLAEQHGYILVAPLGFRVDGGYGSGVATPPVDPVARRSSDLSEQDVMHVLAEVRKHYNIDPDRIYLMGHSLGAIGTWKLAAKYPDVWAAIGPFAGQGAPATMDRMKHIPAFVVHGDNDPTVGVRGSRTMVEAMKAQAVDFTYIEVPGGNHSNVVEPNLPGMLQFFSARRKGGTKSP